MLCHWCLVWGKSPKEKELPQLGGQVVVVHLELNQYCAVYHVWRKIPSFAIQNKLPLSSCRPAHEPSHPSTNQWNSSAFPCDFPSKLFKFARYSMVTCPMRRKVLKRSPTILFKQRFQLVNLGISCCHFVCCCVAGCHQDLAPFAAPPSGSISRPQLSGLPFLTSSNTSRYFFPKKSLLTLSTRDHSSSSFVGSLPMVDMEMALQTIFSSKTSDT